MIYLAVSIPDVCKCNMFSMEELKLSVKLQWSISSEERWSSSKHLVFPTSSYCSFIHPVAFIFTASLRMVDHSFHPFVKKVSLFFSKFISQLCIRYQIMRTTCTFWSLLLSCASDNIVCLRRILNYLVLQT